jgi:hypothetical protein
MNNYYKKNNCLLIVLLVILYSSCNPQMDFIKNNSIKKQIQKFSNDAKTHLATHEINDTLLIRFFKYRDYFRVAFDYKLPSSYDNLYAVIKEKKQVVFIYADTNTDISRYFSVKKPYKIDTSYYKITRGIYGPNWYNYLLYFNGYLFARDTLGFR